MTAVWLSALLFWIPFLLFHVLTLRTFAGSFHRVIRRWGRFSLALLGVRLVETNASTLETREARVVVVNHQSALDLLWGAAACAPHPLAIGKREVLFIPLLNLVWWALRFIRIDRKDSRKAIQALQGVAQVTARERRSLFIAPEGTRTRDGEMLPFKKGAFHIAIEAQAPICPLVVTGAFELMPRGSLSSRPGTILLRYLEPIPTQGMRSDQVDELAQQVRARMLAAYEELRAKHPAH